MVHDPQSNGPQADGPQSNHPLEPTPDAFRQGSDAYRQAIEACRPNRFDPEGKDWTLPEVAPLADEIARQPQWSMLRARVSALDAAIAGAMEQAPVPEGLAERLLTRLRQADSRRASEEPAGIECAGTDDAAGKPAAIYLAPAEDSLVSEARTLAAAQGENWRRRLTRRRWWLSGALAAAAAVCVAAWWGAQPVGSITYEELLTAANDFDSAGAPGSWMLLAKSSPQQLYAIPASVSARGARRWKFVSGFVGRKGVAYDLSLPGRAAGTLYVVPLNSALSQAISGLRRSPGRPRLTGGRATAAWTDGERLFVLVVRGGEREYQSFLRNASMA